MNNNFSFTPVLRLLGLDSLDHTLVVVIVTSVPANVTALPNPHTNELVVHDPNPNGGANRAPDGVGPEHNLAQVPAHDLGDIFVLIVTFVANTRFREVEREVASAAAPGDNTAIAAPGDNAHPIETDVLGVLILVGLVVAVILGAIQIIDFISNAIARLEVL
ncbi:hypothetical protein C8R44DRAFT_883588 [Mycena epipterygia]|nr:hypothetical protein C8R44DRAFT_883588 [Mycena epipterygia]